MEHQDRLDAAGDFRHTLWEAGFHAPGWRDFVSDPPRLGHNNIDDGEPGTRRGWQVVSLMSLEERFVSNFVATPHAPARALFLGGASECALHQFPSLPPQPVRLSAVPRVSSTPPLVPSSTAPRAACTVAGVVGCPGSVVGSAATQSVSERPRADGLGPSRRFGQPLSRDGA